VTRVDAALRCTAPAAPAVALPTLRPQPRHVCARLLVQEEEYRAKERLAILKRANELLSSKTDRMMALKSQMTVSDVEDVRVCACHTLRCV
jgi:hypothetical protein